MKQTPLIQRRIFTGIQSKVIVIAVHVFLFIANNSFGQDCNFTGGLPKQITLKSQRAKGRIKVFTKYKNKEVKTLPQIIVGRSGFISFLHFLREKKGDSSYNGVRVYFTQKDSTNTALSLLFVPTTYGGVVDSNDVNYDSRYNRYKNIDDTDNCWSAEKNAFMKVPKSSGNIEKWVDNFQNHDLESFQQNMHDRASVKKQTETRSQWYGSNFINGVYDYISCDTLIDSVKISYAGYRGRRWIFDHKPYTYKLTLVYEFMERESGETYTLKKKPAAYVISEHEQETKADAFTKGNANADTGSPCPPATCSGVIIGKH